MDPNRWREIDDLFQAAAACPPSERKRLLRARCGGDSGLRMELESLLAAHERSSQIIDSRAFEIVSRQQAHRQPHRLTVQKIGRFRLCGFIGAGGTGAVYEAEQESPRRTVALKLMRALPHSDELTAKLFRREGLALSRMQHPGIAAIYDAGQTDDGWHYFAMERVVGRPLTQYVSEKNLGIEQRLELFARICDAVHYAHQRGVIHRDLKPSNIMVTDACQPKILDFGLARIVDPDAGVTQLTQSGAFQGTLAYASPEQARGRPDDIDVRSDVYSLGVVLYELMTDRLPYETHGVSFADAARVICEQRPQPFASIRRDVRGDLETIVLKALEKEPDRRYASAAALGEDIRLFLSAQPILAHRPSTAYQIRKLVSRHKLPFALAAVLLCVITGSAIAAGLLAARFVRQRNIAQLAQLRATEARDKAEDLADEAQRARAHAERRERQTNEIVECLGAVLRNRGDFASAVPRFEMALARARESGEPLHEANIAHHLGLVLRLIGKYDDAKKHFLEALELRRLSGAGPQRISRTLTEFGQLALESGDHAEAERRFREAIALTDHEPTRPGNAVMQRVGLGRTLTRTANFVEAEQWLQSAWELLSDSPRHPPILTRQTVEAFAELYEAWSLSSPAGGYAEKAADWRARLVNTSRTD